MCKHCGTIFGYVRRTKPRELCSDACKRAMRRASVARWDAANHERRYAADRARTAADPERERARHKRYREANREKISEYRRAWYDANRERALAVNAQWADANRDSVREAGRRWRLRNPDVHRSASRKWRASNANQVRAQSKRWRSENPDRVREMYRRRRTRRRAGSLIRFTPEQLAARLSMFSGCWICGASGELHVDHVKPLSRNGSHILANLRPICAPCNSRKNAQWPIDLLRLREAALNADLADL